MQRLHNKVTIQQSQKAAGLAEVFCRARVLRFEKKWSLGKQVLHAVQVVARFPFWWCLRIKAGAGLRLACSNDLFRLNHCSSYLLGKDSLRIAIPRKQNSGVKMEFDDEVQNARQQRLGNMEMGGKGTRKGNAGRAGR